MSKTIVVADFNAEFRDELVAALQCAGYEAHSVENGADLVRHLRTALPDLLIWSTQMEMDTFKTIDPWSPRSIVAAIPRISIGVPSAVSAENGKFARGASILGKPLLLGRQQMSIGTVVNEVCSLIRLE